ncbi:MAG: hypothetical protein JO266_18080 [Acidobacteria bacterium]|nr:hypothetical protein [Acidobacteriota bacterium]
MAGILLNGRKRVVAPEMTRILYGCERRVAYHGLALYKRWHFITGAWDLRPYLDFCWPVPSQPPPVRGRGERVPQGKPSRVDEKQVGTARLGI